MGQCALDDVSVHPRTLVAGTASAAAVATILVVVLPDLRFAYRAPTLRVALETAAALIALVVAYVVVGRFVRSRRLDDLLLAVGLVFLATANLILVVAVGVAPSFASGRLLSLSATLVGAVTFAVAAVAPPSHVRRWIRVAGAAFAVAFLVGAAVALGLVLAVDPAPATVTPRDPGHPQLSSHPGILAMQSATLAAFLVAALGFTRVAVRRRDEFLALVAIAAALMAFGRLHYLLYPPRNVSWVYTGDFFRLLANVVLLTAVAREISRYWKRLAETAVLEERRRIARDLHDGVAQELAFINRNALRLARTSSERAVTQIAAAAERALTDSRRAIAALTRPLDEPLDQVLAQAVEEVAERSGTAVTLALEPGVTVSSLEREALVRIACEAVVNAARHSQATTVRLELTNGSRVRLRVVDDGIGFDQEAVETTTWGGFGLMSMQERAAALGAELRVVSRPGRGTAVEVELP